MRGKPFKKNGVDGKPRITPAHAGKTANSGGGNGGISDHPRACGENSSRMLWSTRASGSPPRMRGKHFMNAYQAGQKRITPAHAGKTDVRARHKRRKTDHPRACGENAGRQAAAQQGLGSPPRMRGKPAEKAAAERWERITPAHAGKTTLCCNKSQPESDHPRACGENLAFYRLHWRAFGSPPRMRGKHQQGGGESPLPRITPAHAGKTSIKFTVSHPASDHPRACGENVCRVIDGLIAIGSPPRMRGKPLLILDFQLMQRITPAHAGKTLAARVPNLRVSDHPRACGENENLETARKGRDGSPPRMRGKPVFTDFQQQPRRITPAHAGKTRVRGAVRLQKSDHPRACGENSSYT